MQVLFGAGLIRMGAGLMAASLLLGPALPTAASAQAPPAPPSPERMKQRLCADMEAHFAARMAFIETKIGLKAEQRSAWETFVAALRGAEKPMRERCQAPPAPPPADDPVAHLDARDRRDVLHAESQQVRRAAVARLRAALEPEQQRRLAEAILSPPGPPGPPGPWRGPPGPPGMHHPGFGGAGSGPPEPPRPRF